MYSVRSVSFIGLSLAFMMFFGTHRIRGEGTAEPGPHAANFKMLNNSSGIDNYTGSLNWDYELLTVPGRGGLDFPINLTYHSGIGCEQEASWVGLGFGLNLGSIERSVVFVPDDLFQRRVTTGGYYHQYDGWLFDDNYKNMSHADSAYTDGPDMWTVALSKFGSHLRIVVDSTNIFLDGDAVYGPAGLADVAAETYSGTWLSQYQRPYGLIMKIGDREYAPDSSCTYCSRIGRQRHCYVSPPMGTTHGGWTYDYSGQVHLAFNDRIGDYGDNSGQCSVYVHKLPAGSFEWEVHGPFSIDAATPGWQCTGVSIGIGDRFGLFVRTRRFVFEKWNGARVDYEVEFSDWNGYYINPENMNNPWNIYYQGYTPRIKSFTITSSEGTVYKFENSDYINATSTKEEGTELDHKSVCLDYSYKLTSILSHDYVDADEDGLPSGGDYGSWVRIGYEWTPTEINYANKPFKAFEANFYRFATENPGICNQRHYIRYPVWIETPTHYLQFFLSDRQDNPGHDGRWPKKLDSLALHAKKPTGGAWDSWYVRSFAFDFANCSLRPGSFENWSQGEPLGWHVLGYHPDPLSSFFLEDSVGKLTLLGVQEKDVNGNALPALKFRYGFNPRYRERCAFMERNELVDFYFDPDAGLASEYPYYFNYYRESWGYYRSDCDHKPGDDQRAWSLTEILYPGGAKETLEWESNKYRWTVAGGEGYFYDNLEYKPDLGSLAPDGVERGGIRVKSRRLDGGLGTDSALVFNYGEGVATRTQTSCKKALYTGFLGNSQEVGYRSSEVQLEGDSQHQTTQTYFTNGSAPETTRYCFVDYHNQIPEPPVCSLESFRDHLETCFAGTSHVLLNGIARGLPYKQVVRDSDGDLLIEKDISYEFDTKAAFSVDMSHDTMWFYNMPGIKARSTWVKRASENKRMYDENGQNPIEYITTYDYDTVNGLVVEQNDLLGNGLESRVITEFLHTQDSSLKDLLAQKNTLNFVRMQEVQEVYNGVPETVSRTTYEYNDFGNGRVYLSDRHDFRNISPSETLTTIIPDYDLYGNPTLTIDPCGTKTARRWGYNGTKLVLEAPNADTGEVSYTGFEDSLTFDGWNAPGSELSAERAYSGNYSAKVVSNPQAHGLNKSIDDALLTPGQYYVLSGWAYTTGSASLRVDLLGIPGGPEFEQHTTAAGKWERIEIVFQYPEEASGFECSATVDSDTAYFDDLRIHPFDCPMQTYAYDRATGQLQAAFDANNVAAERYFYDGFGRLSEIKNPADTVIAHYVYYCSRSGSEDFDPENPNHVLEVRCLALDNDYYVTKTFYDGLNREIRRLESIDPYYHNVSGKTYNPAGQIASTTKPIELCLDPMEVLFGTSVTTLVPSDWQVGTALTDGPLSDYYDSSGPGPDCYGYPYTQYTYSDDPLRRLKEIGFPDTTWKAGSGRTYRLAYLSNSAGDVESWGANELTKTQMLDEGVLVGYEYADCLGRVVQTQIDSIDADGSRVKTLFDYDILGNITRSIRQRSETETDTTVREYNALSQLMRELSPDGGATSCLYDRNGNLRFVMDSVRASENEFVYYKYDPLNRLIEEGIVSGIEYFNQHNADSSSFPVTSFEIKFSYSYDSLGVNYSRGRLSSWVDGSGRYGRKLFYDDAGRVVSEEFRVDDSVVTFSYTHDWQGNLKTQSVLTNEVFPTIHYTYDWANRLVGVGNRNDQDAYANITYWPDNTIRQLRLNDNSSGEAAQVLNYTYNPRGWLTSINDISDVSSDLHGNTDHFSEQIGYMNSMNGDIDTVVTKHSGEDAFTETFKYDRLRRLMRWHDESSLDTTTDEIFHYDRAGNFTFWKPSNYAGFHCSYYPGTNRLERVGGETPSFWDYSCEYDLNGNLVKECKILDGCPSGSPSRYFEQEYRNIVSRIQMPYSNWDNYVDYVYDADLHRVKKLVQNGYKCYCVHETPSRSPGGPGEGTPEPGPGEDCVCYDSTTTLYFYTHDGRLVREMVNGEIRRDYLFAGGGPIGVAERIDSTDRFRLCYFVRDHLGSTRQVVDSTGQVLAQFDYYPYGALRRSFGSLDTKLRFTGKQFDDEEVKQYYYGARYLNGINQRFNSVDPAAGEYPGWSPYVYALANPVRNVDPNGEFAQPVIVGAYAAAVLDVLDVYAFTVSLDEFRRDPSIGTGLVALGDAAGMLPVAFGYGRIREISKLGSRAWDWVTGAKKAEAASSVSRSAETAVKGADNVVETSETARRSFSSFAQLKRVLGPAGEGKEWHHIVTQAQESRFGADLIHSTDNVVAIPIDVHIELHSFYGSKQDFTDGMRVRDWLKSKSFQEQYEYGAETLRQIMER